ncbi:unnamed protein product [Paramecium octaurelia]|uniref:Uncharacterized protein n=1 Tax=Paramecium octaurelia TaxID=43137 RepID=A0A8S1Y657_PAROT|nr:unnamed protein product [Paramecium octaurelia]
MSITLQESDAVIGSIDLANNGIILKGFYLPKRQCSPQPKIIYLKS